MQTYRPDIDGLRAIAIIPVIIFHFFPRSLPGGFAGVDIFFVISGYLITSIILNEIKTQKFKFSSFYERRVNRIFPALIIVFSCSLIFGHFFLFPDAFSKMGKHILGGGFFVSNLILNSEVSYFDSSADLKPFLHLWSLAIEEQFYIFWPLAMVLLRPKEKKFSKIILVITLISFVINIIFITTNPTSVFYLPFFRFWEIFAGSLLAIFYYDKKFNSNYSHFRSLIGFVLIALAIGFLKHSSLFPGWWALLPVIGTMILISTPEGWFNREILNSKPMILIGLISYPLYLWHWPLIVNFRLAYGRELELDEKWYIFVLSLILSIATYKLVELPLKRLNFKHKTLTLITLMSLISMLGAYVFYSGGIPERYPKNIREIAAITKPLDYFNYYRKIRHQVCHEPSRDISLTELEKNCISNGKKMIFLWGDSFAASLYPGLSKVANNKDISIAQFTVGNAPPFFSERKGSNGVTLSEIATRNLSLIKKYKPSIIILSWMFQAKNTPNPNKSIEEIRKTINSIKKASSNSKIFVIGPVPQWEQDPISLYLYYWKKYNDVLPKYSDYRLVKKIFSYDKILQFGLSNSGAKYLSTIPVLCRKDKCLTWLRKIPESLIYVDYSHLSAEGAIYLMSELQNHILNEL